MQCIIPECGHDSSITPQRISYHLFPKEPSQRMAWLEALHRTSWEPDESSLVCSRHFRQEDLLFSSNGVCTVRAGAVPVIHIQACRICFATNCNLYSMKIYKDLSKAYETLTGLLIEHEDNLPPYLCPQCTRRLMNCARFRNTTLQANSVLLEIIRKHGHITPQLIQTAKDIKDTLNWGKADCDSDIQFIKTESSLANGQANMPCSIDSHNNVDVNNITTEDHVVKSENLSAEDTAYDDIVCIPSLPEYIVDNEMNTDNYCQAKINSSDEHLLDADRNHGDVVAETREEIQLNTTQVEVKAGCHQAPAADGGVSVNNRFSCDLCSYQTYSELQLLSHLKGHAASSYITLNNQILTRHLKLDTRVKSYSCDICNKAFTRKDNLTNHIRTHSGDKPFSCDVCDKTFVRKDYLTAHMRIHSNIKPYSCNICNKTFIHRNYLADHMITHSSEKPYSCDLCHKTFNRKNRFNDHVKTHSGVKPFLCVLCHKTFMRKDHLNRHLTTHSCA